MNWMRDFVYPAKLPNTPHLPWTVYQDSATLTFARHRKGIEPKRWVRVNPFGYPQAFAQSLPMVVDGKFVAYLPSATTSPKIAADALRQGFSTDPSQPLYIRPGRRGESINSPYITWHGHHRRREDGTIAYSVRVPMFVGIDVIGGVFVLNRDGSFAHEGDVPVTTYANDFSYSSRNRKHMFVTDVAAGRILHVDRSTAPWTTRVFCEGLGQCDSVREVGGVVYTANSLTGQVWAIDNVTGAKRVLCTVPGAFWIDHDSQGQLVVMTTMRGLFKVNRSTGAIGPNIMPSEWRLTAPTDFGTVEVDRTGCLGRKDVMYVATVRGQQTAVFRVNPDGVHERYDLGGWPTMSLGGHNTVGLIENCEDSFGHYMWVAVPCGSDDDSGDAALLVQGKAETHPTLILGLDDDWKPMNYAAYPMGLGRTVWIWGTDPRGPELKKVPSFTTQMNDRGGGLITFDHIAAMPLADACAFVRGGMASVYPRSLPADALRAAILFAHANSQNYLKEGAPYIDRVWAGLQALTL